MLDFCLPLSSSKLVLAVFCDAPVSLSLLVSRTPRVCGCSPLLAPRGACSGLLLEPCSQSGLRVQDGSAVLGLPGSAVLHARGVLVPEGPPALSVSSAGISPGKKGPSTLACSQLSSLSSGAVRLRTPLQGQVKLLLQEAWICKSQMFPAVPSSF